MEQRTKEWKQARLGLVTASNFHKLTGARGIGKTGESYVMELVAGIMGVDQEEIGGRAIEWGVTLEADAREYFRLDHMVDIQEVGFIRHNGLDAGCSPDGKGDGFGIEIKCPYNPANHISYMMVKDAGSLLEIESRYYWQVMFSMWVTGWPSWYFISYDPRFSGDYRLHSAEIRMPDGLEDFITERVQIAQNLRDKILKEIGYATR